MTREKTFQMRTTQEFLDRIDEWCRKQVPEVSRAHALHAAMDFFLETEAKKERKKAQEARTLENLYEKGFLKRPRQKGRKR